MYNKVLTGILTVLIIAILGVAGYLGYGCYEKIKKNSDANEFLENEFDTIIVPVSEENPQENLDGDNNENTATPNNTNKSSSGVSTNNGLYYKGFKVAGKIEMPSIRIKYPVLDVITHANAIEVSVGILYGPGLNNKGNTVIVGHNYNNGLFFGKNKNLKIGDKIYITDLSGNRVEYTIYNKYTTPESDSSFITRNTGDNTEVTLVTCDATGKNRLVVCAKVE